MHTGMILSTTEEIDLLLPTHTPTRLLLNQTFKAGLKNFF
jgi:hypothetical protein